MTTPSSDPAILARQAADAMYARDRATRQLGIELLEIGPGRARMRMKVREEMLNGHETCHGGFIFTLADSAFAFACNSHNLVAVAAACSIEFLAPARLGDALVAVAIEQALAGRSGIYDVRVETESGALVALFRGKSARVRGHLVGDEPPAAT